MAQKLLLSGDQHQDSVGFFGTPLQAAAFEGNWLVINELIDEGADVNAVSGFYGTALQAACYNGHRNMSCRLLERGANVNSSSGHYGTPLQAAAYGGHTKLVFLLAGLFGSEINTNDGFYGSPLIAAVEGGHEEVMELLRRGGARLNADGNTNYPYALYRPSAMGDRKMVALLLQRGADPNKNVESGRSALEAAIQGGHSDVVQLFLQNGAKFNRVSSTGLDLGGSAPQMAARGGHKDLLDLLLRRRYIRPG